MAGPPAQHHKPVAATTTRRAAIVTLAVIVAVVGSVAIALLRPSNVDSAVPITVAASNVPVMTATTIRTWTSPATTPAYRATPSVPPSTTPPAPVPAGGVLPPNGSVMMRGDSGEAMTLTVTRIDNPAPARDPDNPSHEELPRRVGYRLVAVHVLIENTGGVPFLIDIEKHAWLVDKAGHTHPRNREMTDARQLHPASILSPESWNGRVIVFEVKGDVDLTRFRLSLHPGAAQKTQDWRLI